jgi:hypothetical protein
MRSGAQDQSDSIGEQNRTLLPNHDGSLAERARTIIITPAARFGEPEALVGVLIWLCGPTPASSTGSWCRWSAVAAPSVDSDVRAAYIASGEER